MTSIDISSKSDDKHCLGAAHELEAASYFIRQGCQVYFPVIQHGSVDFVVDLHGLKRVQVKTAWWNKSDNHTYLQCRIPTTNRNRVHSQTELYDLLVILHDGNMWIIPSDAIDTTNVSLISNKPGKVTRWEKYRVTKAG